MNNRELKLLAQRYLDGTATEEEKRLLHQWYDANHDGWAEHVKTEYEETSLEVKDRLYASLQSKKRLLNNQTPTTGKSVYNIKKLVVQVISIAAIFLIAFFLWPSAKVGSSMPLADKQLVNAPLNKVMQVTLPDSSKVWLSAGSVFKYPKKFASNVREVQLLEGRAFFDVKHQAAHPFIVKTKSLNITVLGTSFDVQAFRKEGTTKVSVVTGKVGITLKNGGNKQAIYLLPKQQIVLNRDSKEIVKEFAGEEAADAWCKNILVFDQENLGNVFAALDKKYHTHITVEDKKLLTERISLTLSNQHLNTIIEILSFTKHFKYQMANDSTVLIKK
jgi:transmembrane sensor